MLDTGLKGRVVLVTGGDHGIGAQTAKTLAAQGAKVAITYLRIRHPLAGPVQTSPGLGYYYAQNDSTADAVVQAIREWGGEAAAIECDLADPTQIPALFDWAEATFGAVEILVNNAAHCVPDTFLPSSILGEDAQAVDGQRMYTLTAATHDQHFAVNSRALALMIAEFAKRHIARGAAWGRIINITTDGAPAFSSEISYGASKYALESYSRAAALELGAYGITVNIISPGPIQTGWITPEQEKEWGAGIPLKRIGNPEDVADVIAFYASEQARYLTGQILHVGGGHRMI